MQAFRNITRSRAAAAIPRSKAASNTMDDAVVNACSAPNADALAERGEVPPRGKKLALRLEVELELELVGAARSKRS